MFGKVLMAFAMVGLVAVIHAGGLVVVLRAVVLAETRPRVVPRFWSVVWLLVWVPLTLVVIHLLEIAVWACLFWWQRCFSDAGSSLYFAGVTYTTLGYGDLMLPVEWRQFGPLMALTGVLSLGLSVGFFVAVMGTVYQSAILQDRSARTSRRGSFRLRPSVGHNHLPETGGRNRNRFAGSTAVDSNGLEEHK